MAKFNKILVAVDGSEASRTALRQSFKLAFDEKKWITVVSINPPYQGDLDLVGVSNISEVLKGPGEKNLEEARQIAEAENASIKTRLEEGEPFQKIVEVAEEERCELIVIGRRGMSGIERTLMGSVTSRVIGSFRGRTLVVPEGTSLGWNTILVATDGSKFSSAAVDEAIDYARSYGGSLKIVSVVYTNDEFLANAPDVIEKMVEKARAGLNKTRDKAKKGGVDAEVFVREGEPYQSIVELAKELNVDTIVMGSHRKSGLKRIFMGSVTSMVIGHAPCGVLVVNK
ncbi:MAG: universal stress protein [Nitrospiraceae bacterium]|nr:MAG: universal stress protein [Nitrospiraceae bacterium]